MVKKYKIKKLSEINIPVYILNFFISQNHIIFITYKKETVYLKI